MAFQIEIRLLRYLVVKCSVSHILTHDSQRREPF
jgi:hypothetical protein